jgi:ubiquinone/menaquinone biosynthesis C-methylase UbiE
MTRAAAVEAGVPLETLLRLPARGPRALADITRLVRRGDWQARALALSAAGVLLHDDARPAQRRRPLQRLPLVSRLLRARPSRRTRAAELIAGSLGDRAWFVRAAAALALGESRDPRFGEPLRARLGDALRPVRLAAAASLAAVGVPCEEPFAALIEDAEPAPERIGDTALTLDWLAYLTVAHLGLLDAWGRAAGVEPRTAGAWAALLAGATRTTTLDSKDAEIRRYAQEKETHYHFTKPFTPVNRGENVRLLHAFLVLAENLRAPQGARVLDLGGGSAWVSELLAKLGFRPVTLDLAPALLRIGRDRFRREHLPARLTCGDMTALPFAAGAFDAVVVIDALHHVPDVPAVFREAFRVLTAGGQFLLAEPGEGHAETEKSRGEMLEHGVAEREIHLFEAAAYGRAAGFDRVGVVPHHVPAVTLTPEDLRAALRRPAERWRVEQDGRRVPFDEYLAQSILQHPILVFGKGARALDTRLPRELRAFLRPALRREGARLRGTVELQNLGDTLWLRSAGESAGHVRLGLQLMTPERRLLNQDFARAVLDEDVPPGGRLAVSVDVALPDGEAAYVVKLDLVDEHVCWFEDRGNRPVYLAV